MISSLDAKSGLRLVASATALLALVVAIGQGSASANEDHVRAVAAKKKCRKGKKAAAAAKRKCKSQKRFGNTTTGPVMTLPGPTTDTTPTSPATLTWNNAGTDLDLYVWESGTSAGAIGGTDIPNTTFTGDDNGADGSGSETFTALPNTRRFTYGICADSFTSSTNFTLTVQDQTGANHVFTQANFTPAGPITADRDWRKAIFGGFDPDPTNAVPASWCP